MKKLKNNGGITLIALVVTIVVLIILAGITISLVLGENGVLTKAKEGRNNYAVATNEEQVQFGQIDEQWESLISEGSTLSLEEKVVGSSSDWKLNDAKDTIIAYIGDGIDGDTFVIPNYVEDNKIISVGDGTKPIWVEKFSNPNGFMSGKKIKISEGIENIQKNAFASTTGLVGDLILPDSIINIEEAAFGGCSNLNGNLYIGRNVQVIKFNSFGNITFNNLEINMKNIPNEAFKINSLYFNGKLLIGDNVETIGSLSFQECGFTEGIVIPLNVTTIGENAFKGIDKSKITNNSSAEGYPWGAE